MIKKQYSARPQARARPGPGSSPGWVVMGAPQQKCTFLLKNVDFALFRPFLDLLDLKNGTGSKFYVGYH